MNISSHSISCHFTMSIASLDAQKVLVLMKSNSSIFFLLSLLLVSNFIVTKLFPYVTSQSFIALALIFGPSIDFELIFC